MRLILAALLALACAACGQSPETQTPEPQTTATTTTDAPAAAAAAPTPEEVQALVASLPAPLNAADYENGRRVFAQCRSCHLVEAGAGNRVGPNLHDAFGNPSGHAPNFRYSPAMQSANLTWDFPTLDRYLEHPREVVPGTLMIFAGLRKPEDRRDVIAYIAAESKR